MIKRFFFPLRNSKANQKLRGDLIPRRKGNSFFQGKRNLVGFSLPQEPSGYTVTILGFPAVFCRDHCHRNLLPVQSKNRAKIHCFKETEPEQCCTAAKKQCRKWAGSFPFHANKAKQDPCTAADGRRKPERSAPKEIDTDQAYTAKPKGKPQEPAHSGHTLFPEVSSLPQIIRRGEPCAESVPSWDASGTRCSPLSFIQYQILLET